LKHIHNAHEGKNITEQQDVQGEVQAVYEKCLKEQKASTERLSFMKAVQSGNISIVMKLLQNGADIAERNDTGQTSLHIATLNENLEMIQVLLNAGVDVDARDDNNTTALYHAAMTGNEAIFLTLMGHSASASIIERNKNGSTLLHDISSSGHEGIVRLLVDRLVNLNVDVDTLDNYQRTALYLAATNGHSAVVARLLAAGADSAGRSKPSSTSIDSRNQYGTALRAAIKRGHEAVVDVFLVAGCKPKSSDLQPAARGAMKRLWRSSWLLVPMSMLLLLVVIMVGLPCKQLQRGAMKRLWRRSWLLVPMSMLLLVMVRLPCKQL